MTIKEKLQSIIDYGNAVLRSSHDNVTDIVKGLVDRFEPAGLYDDAGNLVCTYDDLVSVYGLDIEKDYTKETYLTDPQSGYNVLRNDALKSATKLVLDAAHIGASSFRGCENLAHVQVRCAKTMGNTVFASCAKLISAEIFCEAIGNATFQDCGELESCIIRGDTVRMEGYTFNKCAKLKNVQLPDGVSLNGRDMFQLCEQLENIVIKGKVHTSAMYMFNGCTALRSVDLSEADFSEVEGTAMLMFRNCKNLQSFTAPYNERMTDASYAFDGCTGLLSADLSAGDFENVTSTRAMFQNCQNVTEIKFPRNFVVSDYTINHLGNYRPDENGDIYIPADWRLLDYHPQEGHIFYDFCTRVIYSHKRFVVDKNSQYFKNDEHGALYTKDGTILLSLPNYMPVENGRYEMAEGVTTLGLMSFNRVRTIDTLVIPNSLELHEEISRSVQGKPETYDLHKNNLTVATHLYTEIRKFEAKPDNPRYMSEGGGIYSKDGKKLITMPVNYVGVFDVKDGCTTICGDAFRYDYGSADIKELTQVNIPASVTDIKEYNLSKLNNLTQVVKVIASDNPVYEVVDNVICLKKEEPEPVMPWIECYKTEKIPSGTEGKINARFYYKLMPRGGYDDWSLTEGGHITKTSEGGEAIVDGELTTDESWKITLIQKSTTPNEPNTIAENAHSLYSVTMNGMPEGRFSRAVGFFRLTNKIDGRKLLIYTDEHRIANDGSPQAEPMLLLEQEEIPDTAVEYSECEEQGEDMGKEVV